MGWMLDEYETIVGHHEPAVFTGKPVELGGSWGRKEATGLGGVYILEALAEKQGWEPGEVTVAIQGFGNVGYWFAYLAAERGFRVVAVSDSRGGVQIKDLQQGSLVPEKVLAWKKDRGSFEGMPETEIITNEELMRLPVTVLVPAALEGAIDKKVAAEIRAKAVIEMANGPVTPEADAILAERQIISIPDILSNAGGVTVSYFEWVQNLYGYRWGRQVIFERLAGVMHPAFDQMWQRWQVDLQEKGSFRLAAYLVAVSRVVSAMRARGRG
jgi:glutamate dehydrogenase/leucine dehydrogenase